MDPEPSFTVSKKQWDGMKRKQKNLLKLNSDLAKKVGILKNRNKVFMLRNKDLHYSLLQRPPLQVSSLPFSPSVSASPAVSPSVQFDYVAEDRAFPSGSLWNTNEKDTGSATDVSGEDDDDYEADGASSSSTFLVDNQYLTVLLSWFLTRTAPQVTLNDTNAGIGERQNVSGLCLVCELDGKSPLYSHS